ncbi:MAG: hypothetical protein HY923_04920 [Elusimicrobia bacterium]|nr:hypothetical protein [Elusimicrobiota bacterium]
MIHSPSTFESRPAERARLLATKRPAIFFYNGIGDHLLALPALRALARAFAGRLTLLGAACAPLFLYSELPVKRIIQLQRRGKKVDFDDQAARQELGRCDLFISLSPWMTSSLHRLMSALGPVPTVGLTSAFRLRANPGRWKHSADHTFSVARAVLGPIDIGSFSEPPHLPAASVKDAVVVRRHFLGTPRMLAVHGETKREKRWGRKRLGATLRRFLAAHPDYGVCLLGECALDLDLGEAKGRVLDCRGLDLATSFALVSQADRFLGMDSCMLHAADLFRVPGVGLFGPTKAREWGFRFGPGLSLQAPGRMADHAVDDVLSALKKAGRWEL